MTIGRREWKDFNGGDSIELECVYRTQGGMAVSALSEMTTQARWIAIVARNVDLDHEHLQRRLYNRRHKRYDLDYGQARFEFDRDAGSGSSGRCETFTLLQISPDGLMLRGYVELPEGASGTVYVNFGEDGAVIRGVVRHATETLGGFKIGVELRF